MITELRNALRIADESPRLALDLIASQLRREPVTIGWLAERYDLPPADVLDQLLAAGVTQFVWTVEGRAFDAGSAWNLVRTFTAWDTTGDLQVELTDEQWREFE